MTGNDGWFETEMVSVIMAWAYMVPCSFPGNVRENSRKRPGNFRESSETFPRQFQKISRKCPGHVQEITRKCQGNVQENSRKCLCGRLGRYRKNKDKSKITKKWYSDMLFYIWYVFPKCWRLGAEFPGFWLQIRIPGDKFWWGDFEVVELSWKCSMSFSYIVGIFSIVFVFFDFSSNVDVKTPISHISSLMARKFTIQEGEAHHTMGLDEYIKSAFIIRSGASSFVSDRSLFVGHFNCEMVVV